MNNQDRGNYRKSIDVNEYERILKENEELRKSLLEQNDLYKALFNGINDCVAIYRAIDDGQDFVFVDFNPSAEKVENINKNKILGRTVTEVFPGVKDFGLLDVFQNVFRTGIPKQHPITLYKDMRIHGWRDNYVYKLNDKHIVAVYTDRTKEKQSEEELFLSAKVFEFAKEGILITDDRNHVIKCNQAFTELTGFKSDEIIGKEANFLKSGLHTDEFYDSFWKELKEKGHWKGEIWDKKKNGELIDFYLIISVVKNAQDEISNYIAIYLDISEQKRNEDYIHHLAYYDVLTSQGNRVLLDNELVKRVSIASKDQSKLAVLFIDLDNFKYINDHYSHNIGDKILIETAKRLNSVLSKNDFLARHGGDEFVIVLDDVKDSNDIIELCNEIIQITSNPYNIGKFTLYVTLSIGIANYPDDANDPQTLLRFADMAMYHAKNSGKNQYSFYNHKMNEVISKKIEIEKDLIQAILHNQFYVMYQPKYCIHTKKIVGLEALVRWQHPTKGLIAPNEFISIAENNGSIVDIGEQVIYTVCQHLSQWDKMGIDVKVAINLSSIQLKDPAFLKRISKVLVSCQCASQDIEFEITESSIMENINSCIGKLLKLKDRGFLLSIDDFGTGYSSMSYLQKLPVDVLKIDRSFIIEMVRSSDGKEIVKAIIALSQSLSLKTVAEGVETIEQETILKELGCDYVQGYFYNKPMDIEDLNAILNEESNLS